eukprot:548859_1
MLRGGVNKSTHPIKFSHNSNLATAATHSQSINMTAVILLPTLMSPNDTYHTCAQETIRTRGSTSNLFATLSDPTRSAPAPSQTPDELPVMCVPSFSSGKKFPKTSSRNWPTVANIFIYVLAVIPFVMELQ